jgi:hypothetical protein
MSNDLLIMVKIILEYLPILIFHYQNQNMVIFNVIKNYSMQNKWQTISIKCQRRVKINEIKCLNE